MEIGFGYSFPAIRGIQARKEYYVSMCPLSMIAKIFLFDEKEINPELRAQRVLAKNRVPEIANYILKNRDNYTFSALTASVDGNVLFTPIPGADNMGTLKVDMNAKIIINDGQHRRAAIEAALKECPDLADECIAVVFFLDQGMRRAQQMFSDLNQYSVKTSKSLSVLYNHRDPFAEVTRRLVLEVSFLRDLVEFEKTSLATRSKKLFTLSSVHNANLALLYDLPESADLEKAVSLSQQFWQCLYSNIREWQHVNQGEILASKVRENGVSSLGIILHALCIVGNCLFRDHKQNWKEYLTKLRALDWSRKNNNVWQNRIMHHNRVSKSMNSVILSSNMIKKQLGLPLSKEELNIEMKFSKEL